MIETEVELQKWWRESCPLFEQIGLVVESATNETFRCRVPLTRGNSNHLDTMHAAVQMAVVEALGGIVGISIIPPSERSRVYGAVRSFTIEFLQPARSALVAETTFESARAEEIRRLVEVGESAAFTLESTVCGESGDMVATAVAEYVVRPARVAARQGATPDSDSADAP